ncbi:MAG: hypothetical protein ACXWZ4_16845 [Gemmatirosa sp.]
MTDGTTLPLDEIRGLVAERTRFETWLGTLEARRSATPAHVFERVWQDYDGRRQRAADALGGHLDALHGAESQLAARHDDVSRALGERRDALAEVDLRAMVGEFEAEEGDRLRREVERSIAELEQEAEGVRAELTDVRDLVTQVRGPEAAAAPAPADAPTSAPDDMVRPTADADFATGGGFDGAPMIGERAEPRVEPRVEPRLEQRFAPGADPMMGGEGSGRETPTGGFAAQGLAQAARGVPTARPDESAVGTATQKTLRCQECGAMNYPTEWYCERCGGELAAL